MNKKFKLQNIISKQLPEPAKPAKKQLPISAPQPAQKQAKAIKSQIDKLMSRLNETNQNIKQTEQLLDVDLFLKKQKQQKIKYAKEINAVYQTEKKKREEKLYKQYNRGERDSRGFEPALTKGLVARQVNKTPLWKDSPLNSAILQGHYHTLPKLKDDPKMIEEIRNLTIIESKYLLTDSSHSLKRVASLSNKQVQAKIFPVSTSQGDLIVNDQYENLISALTLIPNDISQRLYQETDYQQGQLILCRFFDNDGQKCVLTNSNIEVRQFTHKYVNIGSHSHKQIVFWPSIIEKCVKKLLLQREHSLSLSQSIYLIYGLDCEIVPLSQQNVIKENFIQVLRLLLKDSLIGFINSGERKSDSYTNRLYPLVSIEAKVYTNSKSTKRKDQPKQIQNPPKQVQYQYKLLNPWRGKLLNSQARNKFSQSQIIEMFDMLVVIREYPKRWVGFRLNVEFFSNGAISMTGTDWTKNNQYSFTVYKPTSIRIILRNKGRNNDKSKDSDYVFGYLLFTSKEGQTTVSCMKLDALIVKTKSTDINETSYCNQFSKGTYVIVPYSNILSTDSYQFFSLDFYVQKEQAFSFNKAKLMDAYYSNTQTSQQKILSKLQWRERSQKPRIEKIRMPKLLNSINPITNQQIETLGLTLLQSAKIEHYFIPGKLCELLINKSIQIAPKKLSHKKQSITNSSQVQKWQRDQALHILLGYDAFNEEINCGRMRQIINETDDIVDLSGFQLGTEGLLVIMEAIMLLPRITKIDLSNNVLDQRAITYLCYYLEKGDRVQLRQINLSGNNINKTGLRALKGLQQRYKTLEVKGVKQ